MSREALAKFETLKAHFAKLVHHTTYATRIELGEGVRELCAHFEAVEGALREQLGLAPVPSVGGCVGMYGRDLITIQGTTAQVIVPGVLGGKPWIAPTIPLTTSDIALDL